MSTPDLEHLLNTLFEFANRMLDEDGEFFPFGASLHPDGHVQSIGVQIPKEHPPAGEVIEALTATFKQASEELRAIGICMDVRIVLPDGSGESDAICAHLEHRDGETLKVFIPYEKPLLGAIKYQQIFAAAGKPLVFPVTPAN